ncbi:hypothetical protein LCGC14_2163580 [marine sediment metagenome]|uniref:Uncharacterized protein n=1 Tax=marine sediment metagenome TaxID=412755 RepID=A0A0F9DRZ2_9ZZZZ
MTQFIKSLADGQLATTKGTLYTAPADKQAKAKIKLVNTASGVVTVNLYFKASGGTSRRLIPKDTTLPASNSLVMDDLVTLEAADIIEGATTTGSKVDFVINGVQKA